MQHVTRVAWVVVAGSVLAGCSTMQRPPRPEPVPAPTPPVASAPAASPAADTPTTAHKPAAKVFTVAELLKHVEDNPRALLHGTYRVRAQVVGAIPGEECSDVLMLADPESAGNYRNIFDPLASNSEFEHARAIPLVMAGPARGFSSDVVAQGSGVFTGRFHLCEGALRFKIERTAPLDTTPRSATLLRH